MEPQGRRQREPQSLEAWESWVDRIIADAQERGDFDDLPGQGKPLRIEESPFAGGLDVGFGILKNAGIAPYWIELEKEIRAANAALDEITRRATQISRERSFRRAPVSDEPLPQPSVRWWWPFGRRAGERVLAEPSPPVDRAEGELASLRRAYIEKSADLDRKIAQYNAAIPRDLWHLERPRTSPEAAAMAFDQFVSSESGEMPRESGK